MTYSAYRGLDKLNDKFRKKVELFINEVGNEVFITESRRSQERQDYLRSQGLSYVTRSKHQDGLAIDIAFYGSELYPSDYNKWRKIANVAKKYGIERGYDLRQWDKPHFQDDGEVLETNNNKMSKYTDILKQELESGIEPVFSSHSGDKPLTEKEVKELIDIAVIRIIKRLQGK